MTARKVHKEIQAAVVPPVDPLSFGSVVFRPVNFSITQKNQF
jgi:hypothetical protein